MKLSKKGECALRSLINLGIAAEVGRSLVQVAELAASEQIPVKFLEQIMQALRDGGLIVSMRGKFGGYRLAKPAGKITLGEVVRLIDGPLAPISCVSQTAYEKSSCPDEEHCGLRMLMLDVRNAIAGILDRSTLADVVEVTLRKLRRDDMALPFSPGAATAASRSRVSVRNTNKLSGPNRAARLSETEGVLHRLLRRLPQII